MGSKTPLNKTVDHRKEKLGSSLRTLSRWTHHLSSGELDNLGRSLIWTYYNSLKGGYCHRAVQGERRLQVLIRLWRCSCDGKRHDICYRRPWLIEASSGGPQHARFRRRIRSPLLFFLRPAPHRSRRRYHCPRVEHRDSRSRGSIGHREWEVGAQCGIWKLQIQSEQERSSHIFPVVPACLSQGTAASHVPRGVGER